MAGPSSPASPTVPVPATRVITPAADTLRTTLLPVSANRKPPSAVTATPCWCCDLGLLATAWQSTEV